MKLRILLTLLSLQLAGESIACSVSNRPSFRQSVKDSRHVFVFRLESTVLENNRDIYNENIIGKIRIIETLKGGTVPFTEVKFNTNFCVGNRLDTGHYFVSATNQEGFTLKLYSEDRSIVDITEYYSENSAEETNNAAVIPAIKKYIETGELIPWFPACSMTNYTQTAIAPPPPGMDNKCDVSE